MPFAFLPSFILIAYKFRFDFVVMEKFQVLQVKKKQANGPLCTRHTALSMKYCVQSSFMESL
jgi:hypothetical protein